MNQALITAKQQHYQIALVVYIGMSRKCGLASPRRQIPKSPFHELKREFKRLKHTTVYRVVLYKYFRIVKISKKINSARTTY